MKPRCSVACWEEIKQLEADIRRLTLALAAAGKSGWKCPHCGKAHGPQMQTCPAPPRDDRSFAERMRAANG